MAEWRGKRGVLGRMKAKTCKRTRRDSQIGSCEIFSCEIFSSKFQQKIFHQFLSLFALFFCLTSPTRKNSIKKITNEWKSYKSASVNELEQHAPDITVKCSIISSGNKLLKIQCKFGFQSKPRIHNYIQEFKPWIHNCMIHEFKSRIHNYMIQEFKQRIRNYTIKNMMQCRKSSVKNRPQVLVCLTGRLEVSLPFFAPTRAKKSVWTNVSNKIWDRLFKTICVNLHWTLCIKDHFFLAFF